MLIELPTFTNWKISPENAGFGFPWKAKIWQQWGCSWVAAATFGAARPSNFQSLHHLISYKLSAWFIYITRLLPLACEFATLPLVSGHGDVLPPDKGPGDLLRALRWMGVEHVQACEHRLETGSYCCPQGGLLRVHLYFGVLLDPSVTHPPQWQRSPW